MLDHSFSVTQNAEAATRKKISPAAKLNARFYPAAHAIRV